MQFPHLVPDHADVPADVLPSFAGIRNKTLETLYPFAVLAKQQQQRPDKSPKGSVDAPIQELVDLINAHPSFSTLSSCSGRISLFDPGTSSTVDTVASASASTNGDDDITDRAQSGKGSGGWLLVSHDEIEASRLLNIFHNQALTTKEQGSSSMSTRLLSFKLEPMLLHVAAASLKRGQQLLQLALQLGFRESGLIVTATRITVAIRGYGLTLSVPLAFQGPFCASDEYLTALVAEANQRLRTNLRRIQRVYHELERELFRPARRVGRIQSRPLPDLNLWGHAAVAVEDEENGDTNLLVFGGYGRGPSLLVNGLIREPEKASKRSDKIYCLRRTTSAWGAHWQCLDLEPSTDDAVKPKRDAQLGIVTVPSTFAVREGAAACVLPGTSTVAVFGGRRGPAHALDDLLIYTYPDRSVQQPVDVRGDGPAARWGHSFTALSGTDGSKLAVVIGGRNETDSFGSVHVLSLVGDGAGPKALQWESIVFEVPIQPRFHHCTVALEDRLIVFGGLSDPNDLLQAFSQDADALPTLSLQFAALPVCETVAAGAMSSRFGQSACKVSVPHTSEGSRPTILLTGGLPITDESDTAKDVAVEGYTWSDKQDSAASPLSPLPITLDSIDSHENDLFGTLVHHCCVPLPASASSSRSNSNSASEVALLGGGVSGFAFGPCFSSCHHLELTLAYETKALNKKPERTSGANSVTTAAAAATESDPISTKKTPSCRKANVVYVTKPNAKSLKLQLEAALLADKTFRMTAANPTAPLDNPSCQYIAVPVTDACMRMLVQESNQQQAGEVQQAPWMRLVQGSGQQEVPFSTAYFARQTKDHSI